MTDPKPQSPTPAVIHEARLAASLTQTEAAQTVRASLRGWQQWEAGDRAMPPGLFELFMLKTRQWSLGDEAQKRVAKIEDMAKRAANGPPKAGDMLAN
ncbi:hypothetical protein AAFF27_20015 [Xylophilus sp. GW821-FHT01B05]